MFDLLNFIKNQVTTNKMITFNSDGQILSSIDVEILANTKISDFVRLEDLQKSYIHRESKRLSKYKKQGSRFEDSDQELEDVGEVIFPQIIINIEEMPMERDITIN